MCVVCVLCVCVHLCVCVCIVCIYVCEYVHVGACVYVCLCVCACVHCYVIKVRCTSQQLLIKHCYGCNKGRVASGLGRSDRSCCLTLTWDLVFYHPIIAWGQNHTHLHKHCPLHCYI